MQVQAVRDSLKNTRIIAASVVFYKLLGEIALTSL